MKNTVAIDRMYRYIKRYTNTEIEKLTKEELDAFAESLFCNKSYTTAKSGVSILNKILVAENNPVRLTKGDYVVAHKTQGIITKKELDEILVSLDSYQDQFIFLCLFNGIAGKQMTELLNLKEKDIDITTGIITLPDRIVTMDAQFKEITKKALNQTTGSVISLSGDLPRLVDFEYNMESKYAIKVRPYVTNNMGTSPMSYGGIRTKIKNICTYLDLDVTVASLEKSGYLHRMHLCNREWTIPQAREWTKKEGIKVEGFNLLSLYKEIY